MGDFTEMKGRGAEPKEICCRNEFGDLLYPDQRGIALLKLKLAPDRAKSLSSFYDTEVPTWGGSGPCTPTSFHSPKLGIPHDGSPVASHGHEVNGLQKFLPRNGEESINMYSCDEFRMFEFKVRRCMRARSHDWTECPFAHPAEKARRRDPRRFYYDATPCSEFRKGSCKKGDACEFSHGVFECWLHPLRYRTQLCKDGQNCKRKVCFFAHSESQLRILPSHPLPHSFHGVLDVLSPTSTLAGLSKPSAFSPPLSPPEVSPPRTPEPRFSRAYSSHPSHLDFSQLSDSSIALSHPGSGLCQPQPGFGRLGSPLAPVVYPEDVELHLMQSLHMLSDSYPPHISGFRDSPRCAGFHSPVQPVFSQDVFEDMASSFHSMNIQPQESLWTKPALPVESDFSMAVPAVSKLRSDYSPISTPQAVHGVRQRLFFNEFQAPVERSLPVPPKGFQYPPESFLESGLNGIKESNFPSLSYSRGSPNLQSNNECGYNLPDPSEFDWVDKLVQEDAADPNVFM